MKLQTLTLQNFRNLSQVSLTPSVRATIAVGQNGQGKTNLLEGLYLLATLKPLRAARLAELIRFGTRHCRVGGRFRLGGAERDIAVELTQSEQTGTALRQAFVDGKKVASLDDYFGGVAVVAFTPDDLAVVKGGPDGRRAFLDRAVFNRFPAYLKETRDYARALKSRNRLLKERTGAPSVLAAFDEALVRSGLRLWARRRTLLAEVAPSAEAAFVAIGRMAVPAGYRYAPAHLPTLRGGAFEGADEAALASAFHDELARRLPRDLERGFSSVGPHADDLALSLGDHAARAFASQGQQRALVLAWKIAEIENLARARGFLPLLLLDDVSSELDPERNAFLMNYLAQSGAQVFLTTTDAGLVRRAASDDTLWYDVRDGRVSPQS